MTLLDYDEILSIEYNPQFHNFSFPNLDRSGYNSRLNYNESKLINHYDYRQNQFNQGIFVIILGLQKEYFNNILSLIIDCPLAVLKCYDLQNNRKVISNLPFITGLYQIFSKSKYILDSLKPEYSIQIYSNNTLGETIIRMLSKVYLKALVKFSKPKFGYSIWKLSLLQERSKLSSSMNQSSMLNNSSFFKYRRSFAPISYLISIPFKIFNFFSQTFGFKEFNPEEERNQALEKERIIDRDFQIELFKDQFKDDLKQFGTLWGYRFDHTENIFKNTQTSIKKKKGKRLIN